VTETSKGDSVLSSESGRVEADRDCSLKIIPELPTERLKDPVDLVGIASRYQRRGHVGVP